MMYGIRTYTNQSYLLNHVDRSATHAVSVIIQVNKNNNNKNNKIYLFLYIILLMIVNDC